MRAALLVSLVTVFAGCYTPHAQSTGVTVAGAGKSLGLAPRTADCTVEFFRTKPPDRAYDEVAALHFSWLGSDVVFAQEAMRAKACELGADAVIVTRDFAAGSMVGTALSYPDRRAEHKRAYVAWLAQELAEAGRRDRAAAARAEVGVPDGYVRAKAACDVRLRATPEVRSLEGDLVRAGALIFISPSATNGFRKAWVSIGHVGWISEDDLVIGPGQGAPAGAAAPKASDI